MPRGISTSCPHCGKRLKVKSHSAIGKRVPCPQCKRPFVVTSQPESLDHFDDFGPEESYDDEYDAYDEAPPRRSQPAPRRSHRSPSRRSGRKKNSNRLLLIFGGLGGLGVALMILLALLLSRSDRGGAAIDSQPSAPPTIALTDEECARQAEAIKHLLETGDVNGLHRMFDWDVFAAASMEGIDMPAQPRREAVELASGGSTMRKLLQEIARVAQKSPVQLLRVVTVDGERHARFRILREDAGVSYYDFVLQKQAAAGIRVVDIYSFFSGEFMSKTLNRILLQIAADESRGFLETLSSTQSDYVKSLEQLAAMSQHVQLGRPAEALQIYHRLPPSVQAERNVLLLRLRAASETANEDDYINAIEMMRKHHPDNLALEFVSIDYYYIKNQFDQVLASVDRVDKALGGDPYLNVLRANAYAQLDQLEKARESLQAAIQLEPTLQPAYDRALQLEILQEQYGRAAKLLNQYEEQFGKTTGEFSKLPQYAEFRGSAEYRNRKQANPPM